MTLGWAGDKVSVEVRDKAVMTLQSKELGSALFNLFLGTQVHHTTSDALVGIRVGMKELGV